MESRPLSRLVGIATIVTSVNSFVFTLILAVDLTTERQRLYILALTGAIAQVILLCTLSHLLIRFCLGEEETRVGRKARQEGKTTIFVTALGVVPSIVAGSVVGAALVWSKSSVAEHPGKILGPKRATCLTVGIVSWVVAIVTQAIFYFSLLRTGRRTKKVQYLDNNEGREYPQMMENNQASNSTAQSSPTQELSISNPSPPSLMASEGTGSLRSSLSLIQRPASSNPKLLIRQHSFPRQSNRFLNHPAPERWSHSEGFDSWDTSEVAPHIRETILQSSPVTRGKPLEPIPGSRSPSPAKALEGPFYPETDTSSLPTSPLQQPTYARTSSRRPPKALDISLYRQGQSTSAPASPLPQPGYSTSGSSQRASPNEAHIHPLFRTCSPAPPPMASSNTVLTAAPQAGQIMSGRVVQRMRSGSLPSRTTALVHDDSFDSDEADSSQDQDAFPFPVVKPLMIASDASVRPNRSAGLASSRFDT